jgi:predicted transcriptional regulator of viral defense system
MGPSPDWDALYRLAAPQGGHFDRAQALEAGYSPQLVEYYRRAGRVERVGRGIFRLVHFPPGEHEDLIVVWLWSERLGVFSHETALALHELSDLLPTQKHLTVPTAWSCRRLRVPRRVELHHDDLTENEITWRGPVPITTPIRTIIDCTLANVAPALVRQAQSQALRRGLFTKPELQRALKSVQASHMNEGR